VEWTQPAPYLWRNYPEGYVVRDIAAAMRHWIDVLGLQHVGYGTKNFATDLQRLLDAGYAIGHVGTVAGRGPFVYLLTEGQPGTVVELLDMSGERERIFARIAEATRNWDDKDPIRTALLRDSS
jgi:hypothetical protein